MVDYFATTQDKESTILKTSNNFDIDKLLESLMKCITPKEAEAKDLCQKAKEIFINEDNLIQIEAPITVCNIITMNLNHLS
jgi:hypothetical protein